MNWNRLEVLEGGAPFIHRWKKSDQGLDLLPPLASVSREANGAVRVTRLAAEKRRNKYLVLTYFPHFVPILDGIGGKLTEYYPEVSRFAWASKDCEYASRDWLQFAQGRRLIRVGFTHREGRRDCYIQRVYVRDGQQVEQWDPIGRYRSNQSHMPASSSRDHGQDDAA